MLMSPARSDGVLRASCPVQFGARLVACGAPAAIALAGDLADGATRSFARALMASIARGEPLVQAVARGHRAALSGHPADWLQPALLVGEHA